MALRPSSVPQRVVLPEPPASSLLHVPDPESDFARTASPTVTRLLATIITDPDFESTATFSLMTTLRVLLCVAAQRDYELHSLDFSTAFLQGSLHEEIWLCRPPGFTGSFLACTHWSLRRPAYGLRQAPREWHDTPRTTLAALGFAPSSADPSLFLRTDTTVPPFHVLLYVDDLVFATADTEALALVLQRFGFQFSSPQPTPLSTGHSLSAPPLDESVEPSGPYPELVGCLMYLMTCTRLDLAYLLSLLARYVAPGRHQKVHWDAAKRVLRYLCSTSGMGLVHGGRGSVVLTGHSDASWADDQATQRLSQGYTFSLGSGSVSWRSTRSSYVLSSSCEAEIYAEAMAAQELRWLTYLLTNLGERPCSPPVLYVDNKAMLVLCREQRLEHRKTHIALRYFLESELQQCRQLRLSYVASRANIADVFTKALRSGDHQHFCTALGPANRLRVFASVRTAVFYGATLCCSVGTPSTCCVGWSPFYSAGADPLCNAGRRSTMLCCQSTRLAAELLVRANPRSLAHYRCIVNLRMVRPTAAIVTMVDPVANAGVADTLEIHLADARKRHADGEYGTIPLLIVELGIRSQWATEHPSRPVSPRPVRNEGGIDDEVDGGARVSGNNGTKQRGVIKVDGGVERSQAESIEPQLEVAGLKGFADGTVPIPSVDDVGLCGEFCATHLLTFMVISRCCLPVVQLALRSCRERLDAGHQAWHFILSTYQVKDDLYITQLEEKMTHIRMGEQESATDYCNRARRILAEMRMVGAEYSTASYISHIAKGLPHGYNLIKRLMMQGQRKNPGGGGSGGGRSTMDVGEKRSTQDKGRGGGGRRRDCWICHDPDHLSYECPDRDDSDEDDTKGGRGRSTSRRPRQDAKPRKEKKTSKKTSSTKDVDDSSGKSQRDGVASCSMVGVVEPTVSLAPEAGEDFQAVAAAVQANPMAVLLNNDCSHHLMGTKAVFIDMAPSDGVKHVRGFNRELQPIEGRRTVALQGEAGKQLQGDGDEMLLVATTGEVLGRARYNGRVLCTDLRPCSTRSSPTEVVALRTIVSATKSTPDRVHARLAHVNVDTIKSSAKHEVATGLDITPSTRADPPCVSCVGGKMARHTFPDKGSDAEEALAVVHIDLCGPFRVAAKDGSLFFLLLKDRYTRFVWVMPVAKKSDVLWEFQKLLVLEERQAKTSVLKLRSDRGGEFLGKAFTDFVDGKGIVHNLTCPYTSQQNGMAEREMRTAVESVRTMMLHTGVQHHWWHLAL
ncbi:unnamed protein product [Closterium sp. NIES-54]